MTIAAALCFHRVEMRKQVLTRQRVLELIDQLQVGQAIPSERRTVPARL